MNRLALASLFVAAACGGSGPKTSQIVADDVAPPPPPATGEEVSIAAAGVTLSATYYAPRDPANPSCAIFVHQLSSTRAEYQPVIDRVHGQGHLLAIDMRGHGKSTAGPDGTKLDWEQFETADWEQVAVDVIAAADELERRGASDACVLVGASIGSSAVLLAAAAHPDRARRLVLLSPGLAYRGVATPDAARAIKAPTLIVHSQESGAVDAATALAGILRDGGVAVEVVADPGDKHGMKIVAPSPKILDEVVGFVSSGLNP